jgi:hypothetical protein
MKPAGFVEALCAVRFENTFNPYSDTCPIHDLADAPRRRSKTLLAMLRVASESEIDAIWIGRDLGYRGGRRTGLALTDDVHINAHAKRWGLAATRPTKGGVIAERTAAVIWDILHQVAAPIFLWNVFPLHPHEPADPFTNRSHNARERDAGEQMLLDLIRLLKPRRLIAIGNDAAEAATRISQGVEVIKVRHPSYGGQNEFLGKMRDLYKVSPATSQLAMF